MPTAPGGPQGHVAVVHDDIGHAEELALLLRGAGHRVSVLVPGRRLGQTVIDCAPDLLLISQSLGDPPVAEVVRAVRQALGDAVRILVGYVCDPQGVPLEADEVLRMQPLQRDEMLLRVASLLRRLGERRTMERRTAELLGLYKMSWAFSLAGGAFALFGHIARHSAEMLKARRGLVVLYDRERRQLVAQEPGFGFTQEEVRRIRYPVDGEAASRWNFRRNGPLVSNRAQADTRLLPGLLREFEAQSLMAAPITRGPEILGLLAVVDRAAGEPPFSDDDLNLLLALAGQATIAVENLRLHEEIKRANALLQEYDRLKSEFVGIVAHDFRKPLMAIRGFAELVLEEPDLAPDTRREFMRTVITETEHLARLANDTLLITQIETGQFSFAFEEIEVGPFLLDAVPLGLSDHSLLTDVPAGFPRIWADPERLRQVLANLVTNAVKYSPAGGSIVLRVRERGAQHIVIEVEDHGLGIPPDQVAKLFQKFARVRTEDHLKIPGSGLGLYICRLIVEGHGGQIWVESEPGRGSTFSVGLPLDARTAARPPASLADSQAPRPPAALPGTPPSSRC
ncbi:MAG TPA: ATP-binding protein [Vicinamibacteria bacterium]|nr:ATP-binding protein [Vicinamibacteria bacterium]